MGILLIATFLIIVFILYIKPPKISTGVDDQGVNLQIQGRTSDGRVVNINAMFFEGELFATVIDPTTGQRVDDIVELRIQHTITNIENNDIEITDIIGKIISETGTETDSRYDDALTSVTKTFTLAPTQSQIDTSEWFPIEDLVPFCDEEGTNNYCSIQLDVEFTGVDPTTGQPTTLTTFGDRHFQLIGNTCSDGTPYNTCSQTSPGGQYCDEGELTNCASPTGCIPNPEGCGCDEGYSDVEGVCTAMCVPGECLGKDAQYCDEATQLITNCELCGRGNQHAGQPLGWQNINANAASCAPDYYKEPAEKCVQETGICLYHDYSDAIKVSLTTAG